MANLFSRIVEPRYPSCAIGLDKGLASVVNVERSSGGCAIRRAATVELQPTLIQPSFDEPNIENGPQLAGVLRELAASAGLLRQKRWSLSLPESTTRTLVLTMESQPQSGSELQDVLNWKMERGFGASLDELSISKERLQKDPQGRDRYLVIAIRNSVRAEYESVIDLLGWRAGLILPRHMGESRWLLRNGSNGDSLLLSESGEGFTAVIFRDNHPLIVRRVSCHGEECEDEFYRLLLFYRDRTLKQTEGESQLTRLLITGDGLTKQRASEIVNETIGTTLKPLEANDLKLHLPGRDLSFNAIAAPAGLATLSL